VFEWLSEQGVGEDELRAVFNLGIGYCAVVAPGDTREGDLVIGRVEAGVEGVVWVDA
jgi:phosphoribosylaminoimidazole (AIR) synthetase